MTSKRPDSDRPKSQTRKAAGLTSADQIWLDTWQRKQKPIRKRAGFPLDLMPDDYAGWLYHASAIDDLDAVVMLIKAGAKVDPVPERDAPYSPLQVATIRGNLDIVKVLIDSGANPNYVGTEGTALKCSLVWHRLLIYHYLVPLTNPREQEIVTRRLSEARRSESEQTRAIRFSEVTYRGLLPTFLKLLAQGIDVDSRTAAYLGKTPLALAAQSSRIEMASRLLDAGADPNMVSYTGLTPLMLVTQADICRLLLKAGANVDTQDDQDRTVVMRVKDEECLRLIRRASRTAKPVKRLSQLGPSIDRT